MATYINMTRVAWGCTTSQKVDDILEAWRKALNGKRYDEHDVKLVKKVVRAKW